MFDQIDERLKQAKQRLRRKQKLGAMLGEAERVLHEEEGKRDWHKHRLDSEGADVQKLEGLSLTGLFYTVLGSKDEQLEKERQEFLAAKLKYQEAAEVVEEARQDVERLRNALAEFADADQQYEQLLRNKERLIAEAGDQRAETLLAFSEQLGDLEADRDELLEAMQAGETALRSLENAQSELRSAGNWGTWDMLGGGMISTAIKHSKIDEAKRHVHWAQQALRHFQEELADAGNRLHVSLNIGGLASFADYFFDGLISDWIVQSKIDDASSVCSTALARVRSTLDECRRRLAEVEKEIGDLTEQQRQFVEGV